MFAYCVEGSDGGEVVCFAYAAVGDYDVDVVVAMFSADCLYGGLCCQFNRCVDLDGSHKRVFADGQGGQSVHYLRAEGADAGEDYSVGTEGEGCGEPESETPVCAGDQIDCLMGGFERVRGGILGGGNGCAGDGGESHGGF